MSKKTNILLRICLAWAILIGATACSGKANLLVETESFSDKGGWIVDNQFMEMMGSPYLMAHGMGVPVLDASTVVELPETGTYRIYARTYNWTSPWTDEAGAGKFEILVNGQSTGKVVGDAGKAWMWQDCGTVEVKQRKATVSLRDLTGFNGRCDAIYFTKGNMPPPDDVHALAAFRKEKNAPAVVDCGEYDIVVVGGGVAGLCTAISSARLGMKVALIHDRNVLGGNNSSEVRVHLGGSMAHEPYPLLGGIVNEMSPPLRGNAQPAHYYEDDKKMFLLGQEPNIQPYFKYRATGVSVNGGKITKVYAENMETGVKIALSAPLFVDCTGDGTIGALAGADYMMGREAKNEFNETLAPAEADSLMMGSSVQWYSLEDRFPSDFPEFQYGLEFNEANCQKVTMGEWTWEAGMRLNPIDDYELIRDYGLMVIFSNWSYLKNNSAWTDDYKNRRLGWVAPVSGKRESRRLIGDLVLTETDLFKHILYDDGTACTTWTVDLHYPDPENTKFFPGREFLSISRHNVIRPYPIPYRCLYSRNIDNLFMAGRNISVTHVALGTVRVMRTTGMMGEVVGMAASLCKKHQASPRDIYEEHLPELISLMQQGVGKIGTADYPKYNMP